MQFNEGIPSSLQAIMPCLMRFDAKLRHIDLPESVFGAIWQYIDYVDGKLGKTTLHNQPSVFKVIPQYCIAHLYCARFLRH